MARRSVGSIVIDIEARTARIEADMKKTQALIRQQSKGIEGAFKGVQKSVGTVIASFKGLAAISGVAFTGRAAKAAIDYGSRLSDVAVAVDTNIVALQVYNSLARDSGVQLEQLQQVLAKVRNNAQSAASGSVEMRREFAALNVDIGAFLSLSTERKLEAIARGYAQAENKSRAYLAVNRILGERVGPKVIEMLTRLGTEGLDPLTAKIARTELLLTDLDAANLDRVGDAIERWKTNALVAFGKVIPTLERAFSLWRRVMSYTPPGWLVKQGWNALVDSQADVTVPDGTPPLPGDDDAGAGTAPIERSFERLKDRGIALYEALRTPQEKYTAGLQEIEELLAAGVITNETYLRQVAVLEAELRDGTKGTNEAAQELGLTFSSAFEDAIVNGEKLSDVLRALEKDILRIIVRRSITEPLANGISSLFGNIFGGGGGSTNAGGILGSIIGSRAPGRAAGGPVTGGSPYMVGERGPEMFVPGMSGAIVPNHGLGDTYYIDARGADTAAVARLERVIMQLHGSIEHRAVAAVSSARMRHTGGV